MKWNLLSSPPGDHARQGNTIFVLHFLNIECLKYADMEGTTTAYSKRSYTVIYMGEMIASHVQAYLFCELYMAIKENPQMTKSILFINTVVAEINLSIT